MGDSRQAVPYQRPSSIRDYESWPAFGYVAAALMALAVFVVVSQGDPGFTSATVLP